jgi:hypothetical protein
MAYVGGPNPNQPLDPSAETAAGQRQRSPNMAAGRVDLVREPGGQGSTFTFTFTLRVHDEHRA